MSTQDEQDFSAAFAAATGEPSYPTPPQADPDPAPAADQQQGQEPAGADSQGDEDKPDPFAALPPEVRDALADVQRMRVELQSAHRQLGQIPAFQSRIDKLQAQIQQGQQPREIAAAPASQRFEKIERIRSDLPEIAEALDELAGQLGRPKEREQQQPAPHEELRRIEPERAPQGGAQAVDAQMEALDSVRPEWRDEVIGTDYQLWLSRQPVEYRTQVQHTKKAGDILKSLRDFDSAKTRATAKTAALSDRQNRMAAAVTPRSEGRAARSSAMTEEEEFSAAFRRSSGG